MYAHTREASKWFESTSKQTGFLFGCAEAGQMLKTAYDELRAETMMLRSAMDALHLHHRAVSQEIAALRDSSTKDRLKINQLSGTSPQ